MSPRRTKRIRECGSAGRMRRRVFLAALDRGVEWNCWSAGFARHAAEHGTRMGDFLNYLVTVQRQHARGGREPAEELAQLRAEIVALREQLDAEDDDEP